MTRSSSAWATCFRQPDRSRTGILLAAVVVLTASIAPLSAQSGAGELHVLLDRAGSRVGEFWSQYARVTSIEAVTQSRLTSEGQVLDEERRSYDYLMVMQLVGNSPRFEESRIERDIPGEDHTEPMLVTTGFSTLLLVFHPYYQSSFEFSLAPDAAEEPLRRIDFEGLAGRRSPSVLRLEGRNYPIRWKGSAWIDPDTGMVSRIETELGESMADLGLETLSARTEYARIRLRESELEYWLPATSTIEALSEHQHWRNQHRFTDYQLFSVESDLSVPEPPGEER